MLSLFLRLVGSGRFPEEGKRLIEKDQRVEIAERLTASLTLKNFSSPRKRANWNRRWFLGSIAVTGDRVLAFAYRTKLLDIPFDDQRIAALRVSVEDDSILLIAADVSVFHEDWKGMAELRFPLDAETPSYANKLQANVQAAIDRLTASCEPSD